ncbi:hypothetical protein [Novosphingobium rosa]|uniref:hypothetical protein n=1 Tax=Novosphingobium rosa TaxID=76978 RepID=UPI0008311B06|nr:hypothetical protein [Novosphingobium rosa]
MINLLNWHRLAAKAQALSRSAYEALKRPASMEKARQEAQSTFDHLAEMGFRKSSADHVKRHHDGKA